MIQKVSFRNYKAYRSLDLELEPFTVLVGPNASGKTTLLEGLHLMSRVVAKFSGLSPLMLEEQPELRSYGVSLPLELGVEGVWEGKQGTARISGTPDSEPSPTGSLRYWKFMVDGRWNVERVDVPIGHAEQFQFVSEDTPFRRALMSILVLRLESRRLAAPSYSEAEIPSMDSDGSGLASVLAHLKLSDDEAFSNILEALKQIVPAVRRIRIERAAVEQTALRTISLDEQQHVVSDKRTFWGNKVILDMKGAKGVPADAAGEGTIMALGLLTVLLGPKKPRLLLLDDIELGLHPLAQGKLIELLRKIQQRDPELQIIATSHSPFILNYLDPKEVRMTFLAENGFARCEKLTAHPAFERWKDLMSPGEFWSTVGESWLEKAGETPVHE
ncbi:AAA family ATPase [Archangium sp. Cb G35]|uniref:AAA family ATPase n=1 Tax=Archangium sp. Cb G35 TaxID=1920190 RepID=UPI0009F8469C|nr:ATP-binding protein [Archangium sp. Cb G35]